MWVRILGCGTSSGVPRIGNDWGACDPTDARNRRTRVSILVGLGGRTVLVDTGPDLREQLLAAGVGRVDAVIWTHDHADHCHGIDDLRQIYHRLGGPVPGFARPHTLSMLRSRFAYAFVGTSDYPPMVHAEPLPERLDLGRATVRAVDQPHGPITAAGLIFEEDGKKIVYATDFNEMTGEMAAKYADADVWIVDCLRRHPHPTHPHLAEVLPWIEELRPRLTLLTHMDHSMDYAALLAELPPTVRPAYDGEEVRL